MTHDQQRADFERRYSAALSPAMTDSHTTFSRDNELTGEYNWSAVQRAWVMYCGMTPQTSECRNPHDCCDEACSLCVTGAGTCIYPDPRNPEDLNTSGEYAHDFITHRSAWRTAIHDMITSEYTSADDAVYWERELTAFDRAFDAIAKGGAK